MFIKPRLYRQVKTKPKDLAYLNRKRSFAPGFFYSIGSLFILALFTLVPFVRVLIDSLNSHANSVSQGFEVTDQNFQEIFQDVRFTRAVSNSFLYMLAVTPGSILISLAISWGISSLHRKYARGFWQSVFFIPYVTSTVAISLTFAYMFDAGNGLFNLIAEATGNKRLLWLIDSSGTPEFGAITIFGLWRSIAFDVLLLSTAMMGVDRQLYKVSALDGAKPWRQFISITVPQVLPTVFYLITLSVISGIKVFPLALFGNSAEAAIQANGQSLLLYIYYMIGIAQYGRAGAASIIMVVISIGIVLLLRTIPNAVIRSIRTKRTRNVDRDYGF